MGAAYVCVCVRACDSGLRMSRAAWPRPPFQEHAPLPLFWVLISASQPSALAQAAPRRPQKVSL